MGYSSRRGRRPDEFASKSSHSHVINDPDVQAFLERCNTIPRADDIDLPEFGTFVPPAHNPIRHVIAIDGGFTEVEVERDFPSAKVAFFQFGANYFSLADLDSLERQPFVDPDDFAELKNIERFKLTLPTRGISVKGESTLTHSIRRTLYEFFMRDLDGSSLMQALAWLLFEQYRPRSEWRSWHLSSCPHCLLPSALLDAAGMGPTFTTSCPRCGNDIFLIDVLRLHEGIDDEVGASGILGYVVTAIEQIILCMAIKIFLDKHPASLKEVLFIKDGPLAFFGLTANLYKPMRRLVGFLFERHALFLAGLEKSGSFVEHADEIANRLPANAILMFNNPYIYRYILPGRPDRPEPYGSNTYYAHKLLHKTPTGHLYIVTLPSPTVVANPQLAHYRNLDVVLHNIQKLKCDMYDSALLPVALVNKLVSLADHPSSAVLKAFANQSIGRQGGSVGQ